MRLIFMLAAMLSVNLCQEAKAADEFPKRKEGLWEVSISSEAGNQIMKQCIDSATDAKFQQIAGQAGQNCTKQNVQHDGNTYSTESECSMAGTKIRARAIFKGDFFTNYQGDISATYDPPLMGTSKGDTKITARWLSACEAGQQPGDMIMPNGMKMNIAQMSKLSAAH